ncbi:MAG: glycosyltransferase family 4 protein [Nocardioidaceae bacterium]
MTAVHVVVPDGIDDPTRPSGGNAYDRRVCRGLADAGWSVHEHAVPGDWPAPGSGALGRLADVVTRLPDGAVVLLDGIVASVAPEVLVREADRLRLVVLVHLPWGERVADGDAVRSRECATLAAAAAVVATSLWSRRWLLEHYALDPARVRVAVPGVDGADLAPGTPSGGELLCVAAVTPDKGHDVLLAALAQITDLRWRCACVGSLTRDPGLVERLLGRARDLGIADRVTFGGPRVGAELQASYAAADVLVLATRAESYGMVVSEALARGLPVVAAAVGGLPEALGRLPDGSLPGELVPPEDPGAMAAALRRWLEDAALRRSWRLSAQWRRETLPDWAETSDRVSQALWAAR